MRPILGAVAWPFVREVGTEAYVFGAKGGLLGLGCAGRLARLGGVLPPPEDDSSEDYVTAFMVRTVRGGPARGLAVPGPRARV